MLLSLGNMDISPMCSSSNENIEKKLLPCYLETLEYSDLFLNDCFKKSYTDGCKKSGKGYRKYIPSKWSGIHSSSSINISKNGLEACVAPPTTKGLEREKDGYVAKTDYPIPIESGIFYFEVEILSKVIESCISIGLMPLKSTKNTPLPGYDVDSYGYHSDDGHLSVSQNPGKAYGPSYTIGDTVGVCIDFIKKIIFFTKNGSKLDNAVQNFKISSILLYPSVGLRTSESIRINFGLENGIQKPFFFDINSYVKSQKYGLYKYIDSLYKPIHSPSPINIEKSKGITFIDKKQTSIIIDQHEDIDNINSTPFKLPLKPQNFMQRKLYLQNQVIAYLTHFGFIDSLNTFLKDIHSENEFIIEKNSSSNNYPMPNLDNIDENEIATRKSIRSSLIQGDIDGAISLVNKNYKNLFDKNDLILFKLRCQKFIEIFRISTSSSARQEMDFILCDSIRKDKTLYEKYQKENKIILKSTLDSNENSNPHLKMNGNTNNSFHQHIQNGANNKQDDSDKDLMDIDQVPDDSSEYYTDSLQVKSLVPSIKDLLLQDVSMDDLANYAVLYAKAFKSFYLDDTRPEVNNSLKALFSLFGYIDPEESELAYLLDVDARESLAEELNSKIMQHLGKSPVSSLEKLLQESIAKTRILASHPKVGDENGSASALNLVNVISDFLSIESDK